MNSFRSILYDMKASVLRHDPALAVLRYMTFGGIILFVGRPVFIPLAYAVLISFIVYPICSWLESKGVKRIVAIMIGVLLVLLLGLAIVLLLVYQFSAFLSEWPTIRLKLAETTDEAFDWVNAYFNVPRSHQLEVVRSWVDRSFPGMFQGIITSVASSLASIILIPIFAALILYYRGLLVAGLVRLMSSEPKAMIVNILFSAIKTYYNFIKGMILVYLIVGILNSIGLLLLGVPHAIFFGFVAAILTFIPYLGIMVGSLLPMAMAWITYGSVWYPVGVALVFMFVQYLEANIIFPFAVSDRLNINALATLLAILVGGILWGVSGMILFVPFLAIIKLIGDYHPRLRKYTFMIGVNQP